MPVKIRNWQIEDAKDLAAALNNKKILNNLRDGLPYPYTKKDAADYINAMLKADPNGTFAYAIIVDGKAVGSIGAFRQENIHARTAQLGYYLAEEYWGKGIMTQAVKQLCDKLFAQTDLLRIFAEPFACNIGSRRVLEKAGFQLEGILKKNAVKNGKVLDMALYARTKTEGPYPVRHLNADEIRCALDLMWEVFLQFVAPEYSQEGIDEFKKSLNDKERTEKLRFYGVFDNDKLVGTLCIKEPRHIGGFFVKADYQGRGFGRMLFEAMKADYEKPEFTVNSSPYAVKIYEHLGFVPTDNEQTVNGIRFTPMKYNQSEEIL